MAEPSPFDELFVLELANNHWGRFDRGVRIVKAFGEVVRRNGVRAAIKLQFRDIDSFVHRHHRLRGDHRYIKKITATRMPWHELGALVEVVRGEGMQTMVTPFDEASVDRCVEFGVETLKVASSDIRDKHLLGKIAEAGKPVIASSGGANLDHIDQLVDFFGARGIPFALNHCVSLYPSEDGELELNQIDLLRERYPGVAIGLSTHEHRDWRASVMIAYAKGARTFERHIDIEEDGIPVSPYCSLPHQADEWFRAFLKAKEMCGGSADVKRRPPEREVRYLDELVRGVYARRSLPAGHVIQPGDVYLAVPLLHGQISSRELAFGERTRRPISADSPLHLSSLDCDYGGDLPLRSIIESRGVAAVPPGDESLVKVA